MATIKTNAMQLTADDVNSTFYPTRLLSLALKLITSDWSLFGKNGISREDLLYDKTVEGDRLLVAMLSVSIANLVRETT